MNLVINASEALEEQAGVIVVSGSSSRDSEMLLLHLFGTMSLWLRFLAKRRPLEFFRQIKDVLVTAFSTSSRR